MSRDLKSTAEKIRNLFAQANGATIKAAHLIAAARPKFGNSLAWLEWCRDDVGISRRFAFTCLKVSAFINTIKKAGQESLVRHVALNDIYKLEILSALETSKRLISFLNSNDISEFDRAELRAAVNTFLGREPRSAQLDFFAKLRLPPPEALRFEIAAHPERIDPEKAVSYGSVILSAAVSRRDELTQEDQETLRDNLYHLIKEVDGFDVRALVKKLK